MKKLFTLLILLVVAVSMFGQEFTIGDLTYAVLSGEEKTAQVVNGQNATGDVVVPSSVTYDNIEFKVTRINNLAFSDNSNITSLSLPSIRYIGGSAFYGCSSLTSVSIPSVTNIGGYAFEECNNIQSLRIGSIEQWCKISFEYGAHPAHYASSIVDLYIGSSNVPVKNLEIPNTITEIHDFAFVKLSITRLSAQTVTSIGLHSFEGCKLLEEAIIPKAENIGYEAFRGSYSYEDNQYHSALKYIDLYSAKSIANYAFEGCNNINSIRIGSVDQWCQAIFEGENANPLRETAQKVELYVGDSETPAKNLVASNALTEIPNCAFYQVSNIESFSAPSATTIGDAAFAGCTSLASIDLPVVANIGNSAFSGCSALASANLPNTTNIESYAFYDCESLEEAIMPNVETVGQSAFEGTYSSDDDYQFHSKLKCVDLSSAKSIGHAAFRHCFSLTSVNLPAATEIGSSAFFNCSALNLISLPSATTISEYAFSGCDSLEDALLPKVEALGQNIFSGASLLKNIDLSSIKSIENHAFYGCSNISSLRIGSVDQWCQVNFGEYYANPLEQTSKAVTLYVGNSETPAKNLVASNALTEIPDYAFRGVSIESFSAPAVTTIGAAAFAGCESLEEAILPKVETIGEWAFGYTDHHDENGNWAPRYCTSLAHVDLSSVKSIGSGAFNGCININSLHIGSVDQWCQVNFGDYANPLEQTSKAVTLYVGNSETPAKNLVASSAVTKIPSWAFKNTNIESISAPSVATIGDGTFWGCFSLASVNLSAATSVGSHAFYNCTSLNTISLPAATTIGGNAFSGCSALASVILPAATTIGESAFCGCTSLASINLPAATTIGACAFDGGIDDNFRYLSNLKHVSIPSAIKIEGGAFRFCDKITHLDLPEAREIGESAFEYMRGLRYLSIPKVETIGGYAFTLDENLDSIRIGSVDQYCNIKYEGDKDTYPFYSFYQNYENWHKYIFIGDSETPADEITIPASVKQIPDYAFKGTDIHTLHYEGTIPPVLPSTNAITDKVMLAVPEEAYETYLAADVYNTIPLQITKEGHITQDLEVEAKSNTSALLAKVGDKEIRNVINLKLKGTINSYDMLIIRNRMTSLRNLDLSEASIVDCDYVYSTFEGNSYHSVKDEITADWLGGVMNVKLPASTKHIDDRAFYWNKKLVTVDIPEGVESIGNQAFYYCNRIKDLKLPQTVTSVGSDAFYQCTGLKEIIIPNGVTSINNSAFNGCIGVEKVSIPESVKEIGSYAFNCGWISLHISSLEAWKDIDLYDGYSSWRTGVFDNVVKLYIGDSEEPVDTLVIPEGTRRLKDLTFAGFSCIKDVIFPASLDSIGNNTFRGCTGISTISLPDSISHIGSYAFSGTALTEVKLPEKIKDINNYTFAGCGNLEKIEFNDSLTTIGSYAFQDCYNLKKVLLPSYLERIYSYAFEGCSNLTEVLIPASIKEIGDYTFIGCDNLSNVIATTVEPIAINQSTFSTYRTSNVYSPRTSYWKYYWNTQWNQFLSVNEYGKKHHYKYFYLRGQNGEKKEDLELDDETGVLAGAEDEVTGAEKAPDADLYVGAGLIVDGEQTQHLKHIHFHHDGKHGASMIGKGKGKVQIDSLSVDINVENGKWYFFCFPFDIKPGDAHYNGSHVWYLYDGVTRANKGNGGWKKVAADATMEAGHGYIFQGAVDGTLTLSAKDVVIDSRDIATELKTHHSPNKNDASWNLIGNLNFAYYDIDNLEYQAPVTIYDNETGNYEAVRPGDDDYHFHPFQAFFVQKPDGKDHMNFHGSVKETKNKSDEKKARKAAARAKAPMQVDAMRKIINLELASAEPTVGSVAVPTDRTRIVLNPTKSIDYETDCDAAKFIADNMPQIYSLGPSSDDGQPAIDYAINERPVGNGIIDIAVKTAKEGVYTISAPRIDCAAKLRDLETGSVVDLTKGGYTFAAEATAYTNRFQLILGDEETAIHEVGEDMATINVEAGTINVREAGAEVKVYTTGGSLVASQNGTGSIHVPAGIYVVTVNGKSTKVTVKD